MLLFKNWYNNNRVLDWINDLPDCPCNLIKIGADWFTPNSDPDSRWDKPHSPQCGYHEGTTYCIRSSPKTTLLGLGVLDITKSANQCCYFNDGKLITEGSGMGSADYWRCPTTSFPGHLWSDMIPANRAFDLDGNVCGTCSEAYLKVRPQKGSEKCNKNPTPIP
jgi:hypothetical protein